MDAYLGVVSKREVREYTDRPIPDDVLTKILQAGRATGSSKNTQPWRFVVLRDAPRRRALARFMSGGAHPGGCAVALAIRPAHTQAPHDPGRGAPDMVGAAWALAARRRPHSG